MSVMEIQFRPLITVTGQRIFISVPRGVQEVAQNEEQSETQIRSFFYRENLIRAAVYLS